MAKERPVRSGGRTAGPRRIGRPKPPVAPLDAEDIAMARLQADLRKAEAIRAPSRRRARLSRTTLRLPREVLQQLRWRARREERTMAEVVAAALRRYLESP